MSRRGLNVLDCEEGGDKRQREEDDGHCSKVVSVAGSEFIENLSELAI